MNLALSLLAAARAHPEAEALPGHHATRELLERVPRIAGGLGLEPGERLATVLDNRVETALLYWAAQWCGRGRSCPLSWRSPRDELDYCIEDCGATRSSSAKATPLPDGPAHPGALDRDEREPSLILYTSGTTGRPKGVPRSHRADRAGGALPGAPARLPHRRPDARRHAPLPHDGHPLAARHARWSAAASSRRRAGTPRRRYGSSRASGSRALYLAPTLYYDLAHHPAARARHLVGARRSRYAGAAMTSALVERCCRSLPADVCSSTTTARPRSTRSRSTRSGGEARLRRPSRGQRAPAV